MFKKYLDNKIDEQNKIYLDYTKNYLDLTIRLKLIEKEKRDIKEKITILRNRRADITNNPYVSGRPKLSTIINNKIESYKFRLKEKQLKLDISKNLEKDRFIILSDQTDPEVQN